VVRRRDLWQGKRRRPVVTTGWVAGVRLDLRYSKRDGYRLVSWAVMDYRGRLRAAGPTWEIEMPKRPSESNKLGLVPLQAAPPGKWLEKTPTLASYFVDLFYEGTTDPREPCYLLVKPREGKWQFTLKDPTEARQLRVQVTEPATGLASLEALLVSETCPWEPDSYAAKAKKKR